MNQQHDTASAATRSFPYDDVIARSAATKQSFPHKNEIATPISWACNDNCIIEDGVIEVLT